MNGEPVRDGGYERDRQARLVSQTVFDRPLVLQAGAGTGKTATLVARIVAWTLGPGWQKAEAELAGHPRTVGVPAPPAPDRLAARVLDQVVAITFTEAAAAEMAGKVGQAFALLAAGGIPVGLDTVAIPGAEVCHERAVAAVVALDHLRVSTIHAFCRRLLAENPLDAGLQPGFTVDAEGVTLADVVQETVEAAFRGAFGAAEGGPLLALAARGAGPAEVAEVLTGLIARGVPADALAADPLAVEAARELAARVGERAHELAALLEPHAALFRRAKNAATLARVIPRLAGLRAEVGVCTVDDVVSAVRDTLPENLLGHLSEWGRGNLGIEERERFGVAAGNVATHAGRLAALARQVLALDPEFLGLARRALAPLLAQAHAAMRARGAETYAALLRDTRDALRHNPRLAARKRAEITQLLVDEFQDTDRLQCEILRLLALEGVPAQRPGLFLIGDPKQSIYGWRNADLAAFDDFLELVRDHDGEVLSLTENFRSLPGILEEVERTVAPIMVREVGVQPAFEPLLPWRGRAAAVGARPASVEYWVSWPLAEDGTGLEKGGVREALRVEAPAVAADIRALHDSCGVRWCDVGVLLRAMSDADEYLQAFRDADIPYVVERDRSYYRRREVIEAAALVRTVLDPGDHLALLTVLRSAVVGVPDAALIPLWARSFPSAVSELDAAGPGGLAAVQRIVREVASGLPRGVPGLERVRGWETNLNAFLAALPRLRAAFSLEPSSTFVELLRTLTLLEVGEAARTLGAYRIANLDRFFRTLVAAIERGAGNPHAVLRALRAAVAEERESEEGRPLAAAEDAVRVLTVHKAKGLDFAHVYLVQAHRRSREESVPRVDAEEVEDGFEYVLFGAATPGWTRVAGRRAAVANAEMVRTLYVAMTRAKNRLVVAGSWPDARSAALASHLDLMAPRIPEGGLLRLAAEATAAGASHTDRDGVRWVFPALAPPAPPGEPRPATAIPPAEEVASQARSLAGIRVGAAERMKRPFSAPASAEAHRLLRESLAERGAGGDGAAIRRGGGRATVATAVGSAVHSVLEELDLGTDLATGIARARERAPATIRALLGEEDLHAAVAGVQEILDRLVGSRVLRRLADVAPDIVARELPVLLPPGDGPGMPVGFVSGTIDVVYRDRRSGELVIADYKTDAVASDGDLAERAATYASQGAAYRRALRDALGLEREPRFELWFLQADRIVELPG